MICVRKTEEKRASRASDWPCETVISSDLAHLPVFGRTAYAFFPDSQRQLTRGDVFLGERCLTGPVEPHEVGEVSSVRLQKREAVCVGQSLRPLVVR